MFVFSVKVMRFNREKPAPDVNHEEHSHSFSVTNHLTETGFRLTDLFLQHTLLLLLLISSLN